ncbi:MBL fold metallo-hydrolase [Salinifilum ghardaiensis]
MQGARSELELVLLGTQAGPPIEQDRAGISSALVVDGATYLVDCGRSATSQFARAGLSLRSLSSIFLTHLHADHVSDYYNFFLGGGHVPNTSGDTLSGPITVHGPGPAGELPPKFGGGAAPAVSPEDPAPGTAAMTRKLHEAIGIHDRSVSRAELEHMLQSHVRVEEVGAVAQRAGAGKLVLSHIAEVGSTELDVDEWGEWAQQGYDGPAVVGEDLQRFNLA